MGTTAKPGDQDISVEAQASALLEPLRTALTGFDESQRYRLLATLLNGLADGSASRQAGRVPPDQQAEGLGKRIVTLESDLANCEDLLRVARADLSHREKQLELEQVRVKEFQKIADDQRARSDALKKQVADLEAQLVARNNDLHQAESLAETLQLKLQRAELAAGDMSALDSRDEANRKLAAQLDATRAEMAQLRADKDAEIERLKTQVSETAAQGAGGADAMLRSLWERLAKPKPPLAEGHLTPTVQSAERLVDAFIELARFVHDFDQSMRPFLSEYTKHHPSVKVPWSVYAERDDFYEIIQQTVSPKTGKHVGAIRMKLKLCRAWAFAAMVGGDSAVRSIASELGNHLRGEHGIAADPNFKIRDYLKNDGPELFQDHMLKLRSEKLAEVYGHGV